MVLSDYSAHKLGLLLLLDLNHLRIMQLPPSAMGGRAMDHRGVILLSLDLSSHEH